MVSSHFLGEGEILPKTLLLVLVYIRIRKSCFDFAMKIVAKLVKSFDRSVIQPKTMLPTDRNHFLRFPLLVATPSLVVRSTALQLWFGHQKPMAIRTE